MNSPPTFNTLGRLRYGQVIDNRNDDYLGRSIELYDEFSGMKTSVFNQLLRFQGTCSASTTPVNMYLTGFQPAAVPRAT